MKPYEFKLQVATRLSKMCLDHFGYKPCRIDIIQKLAHINRIDNPYPIDNYALCDHIISCIKKFMKDSAPYVKAWIVYHEKKRREFNPVQPLPLP